MEALILATPVQIKAYIEQAVQDVLRAAGFQKIEEAATSKYLTHTEAAAYINRSKHTLYGYCSKGKIAYFSNGGNYYLQKDLDYFMSCNRNAMSNEVYQNSKI